MDPHGHTVRPDTSGTMVPGGRQRPELLVFDPPLGLHVVGVDMGGGFAASTPEGSDPHGLPVRPYTPHGEISCKATNTKVFGGVTGLALRVVGVDCVVVCRVQDPHGLPVRPDACWVLIAGGPESIEVVVGGPGLGLEVVGVYLAILVVRHPDRRPIRPDAPRHIVLGRGQSGEVAFRIAVEGRGIDYGLGKRHSDAFRGWHVVCKYLVVVGVRDKHRRPVRPDAVR